jgi:hypothetical protein
MSRELTDPAFSVIAPASDPFASEADATCAAFGCRINDLDPVELFRRYDSAGFIYPAKRARLQPYWQVVLDSWRKALRAGQDLLWFTTFDAEDAWGSVSLWRSSEHGWIGHHMAALGKRLASGRAVFAALASVKPRVDANQMRGLQIWFSAFNRFANGIFGSLTDVAGPNSAALHVWDYVTVPLASCGGATGSVTVIERRSPCEELWDMAVSTRGWIYAVAEELAHPDLQLQAVDERYARVGLRRFRRVWTAHRSGDERALGAIVAYRGPLGLNFSFLENRCDLMIRPDLDESARLEVVRALLHAAVDTYHDFLPKQLFVVADASSRSDLARLDGTLIRRYADSIALPQRAYDAWAKNAITFYQKIMAHKQATTGV